MKPAEGTKSWLLYDMVRPSRAKRILRRQHRRFAKRMIREQLV